MTYSHRALLAFAGLVLLGQAPARAAEYPYCMTYVEGWAGTIERCDYSTLAQCQASSSGLNGSCAPNWRFAYSRGGVPAEPVAPKSKKIR